MDANNNKKLTNPARRLHVLLAGTTVGAQGRQFRHYLAERLGGNPSDDLEMLRKVLGLYDLVSLTERRFALMKHPRRQIFASCIQPIVAGLQGMQLNSQAVQISQQLAVGPLPILELGADALDLEGPEFLIEQSEIDELLKGAQELQEKFESSGLPTELRRILVESLERIKTALKNYGFTGIEGIDRAVKEAYGTVFVEHAVILPEKENPIVRDYWNWLGRINSVVSACKNAYATVQLTGEVIVHMLDYLK
jgi:hypothetical protein